MRGGAPGAVWDSAADQKSGQPFDFSVGLKNNVYPQTAQFKKKKLYFSYGATGSQGHFFAVDIKSESVVSLSTCPLSLKDSDNVPRSLKITGLDRRAAHRPQSKRRVNLSRSSFCLSTDFKHFEWTGIISIFPFSIPTCS